MKIFINGRRATYLDLKALFHNLKNGKDGLTKAYITANELHFETV